MAYFKLISLWLLATFLFYILISTSIMFSRITTLEGVKIYDFKIFIKLIEEIGTDNIQSLINVTNVLAPNYINKNGEHVSNNMYPFAAVTNDKCIENGININICKDFNGIKNLEIFLGNLIEINKKYNESENAIKLYYVNNEKTYIHRKINDNLHLIALTGKYLNKEEANFLKFIFTDWKNYFLKYKSGSSGLDGFKKTWEKTDEAFYIIFSISLLLLLVVIFTQRRNLIKFSSLKEKLDIETKKIEKLNEKYDELNSQKLELEEKVDNEQNEQRLIELNSELEKLKKEISESKKYEDLIFDKFKKQSNNLPNDFKSEELEKIINEMQTIKHLWTREFEWKNRLSLESLITSESTNIPFTLTIAFILFENQFIDKLAKKSDYYEIAAINLEKKIDLVCKEYNLSSDVKEKLHQIRKARNKWFHYGKKPDSKIINDLLSVLEQYEIKADILI